MMKNEAADKFKEELLEEINDRLHMEADWATDKVCEQHNVADMKYYDGYGDACDAMVKAMHEIVESHFISFAGKDGAK